MFFTKNKALENLHSFTQELIEEKPILTEPIDKFKSRFTGDYLYQPDYDIDTPENRFEFLEYLRNKK